MLTMERKRIGLFEDIADYAAISNRCHRILGTCRRKY